MENKKILNNIVWRFLERSGAQGVNLLVSIILARLLLPEDYGIIGILQVLITLMDVFVDSGLASALIQKKNADEMDFSTVFYTNIVLCSVIYLLVFWLAPYFAMFYEQPKLTVLLRVMALQLIISGKKCTASICCTPYAIQKVFLFYVRRNYCCSRNRNYHGLLWVWRMGSGSAAVGQSIFGYLYSMAHGALEASMAFFLSALKRIIILWMENIGCYVD